MGQLEAQQENGPAHANPSTNIKTAAASPDSGSEYNFRLVSVAYKEAALDLPTFRALVQHLDAQLEKTEEWFSALAELFMKVPQKVEEFGSVTAILDYLVPLFLQDSVLDQEYCLAAMGTLRKTLKRLWAMAFSVFKMNVLQIERRRAEFALRVAQYRRLRARFGAAQETYDRAVLLHLGTPKYKAPELLHEDLRQLVGVRREYVLLSLALVEETHGLSASLNQTVVLLNELFWKAKLEHVNGTFLDQPQLAAVWGSAHRVHAWHDACVAADAELMHLAELARASIEAHTNATHAAPASSDEYRADLLNARVLAPSPQVPLRDREVEKHGYLCVKTYADKLAKPVWVRRWAYLRQGVFGFLVLSPAGDSVQETDKIGVLLCGAKYTPNEDRLFCFEVKTIDTTLVLQAETLGELRTWLRVFDTCRTRIVDAQDPMHALLETASSRFPPWVVEFLAPAATQVDRELTSARTYTSAGHALVPRRLSRHLERNEAFFARYVDDSVGRINLPVSTATTRLALMAATLATPLPFYPNSALANILGSINWGLAAMSPVKPAPVYLKGLEQHQLKAVGSGRKYPKSFPNAWIARDLQMRALFEDSVGEHEYCLFAYDCLLAPNDTQQLRATHFLTQDHLYSYVHAMGFVSMANIPLNRFVDAASTLGPTHDLIHLTLVRGLLVLKVFLDDGALLAQKLAMLFHNLASDAPKQTLELIADLLALEKKYQDEKTAATASSSGVGGIGAGVPGAPSSSGTVVPAHFEFITRGAKPRATSIDTAINIENPLPLIEQRTVNLPAKAVFHVLCGAESDILNALNSMVQVQLSDRNLWCKPPTANTYLIRDNAARFEMPRGNKCGFRVTQEIEFHVENEFYSIKVTKSSLQVSCGPRLKFVSRITIQRTHAERAVVKVSGQTVIDGMPVYGFITKSFCRCFIGGFSRHVLNEIELASNLIGAKGKILKAIYFYGKIPVTQEPYEPLVLDAVPVGRLTLCRISLLLTISDNARLLTTWCYSAVQGLKILLQNLTLHASLIAVIVLLALSNVYLSGISARNYWVSRQSRSLVKELVNIEPVKIQRAVYLQDIQDLLTQNISVSNNSACFNVFKNQSMVLNYHHFSNWNEIFRGAPVSLRSQQLRERLNDIATKRNDLLVSLKMLNHLEEEEARAEWRTWLLEELATCTQISHLGVLKKHSENSANELHTSMKLLEEYCDSCSHELAAISGIL